MLWLLSAVSTWHIFLLMLCWRLVIFDNNKSDIPLLKRNLADEIFPDYHSRIVVSAMIAVVAHASLLSYKAFLTTLHFSEICVKITFRPLSTVSSVSFAPVLLESLRWLANYITFFHSHNITSADKFYSFQYCNTIT